MTRHDVTLVPEDQDLKVGSCALVKAAGGPDQAATFGRVRSVSSIKSYGSPNTAEFMPLDMVAALEARTHGTIGHPILTRILARRAGGMFVELPDVSTESCRTIHEHLAAQAKESSEAVGAICAALAKTGGTLTSRDVREHDVVKELDDAIERLAALRAYVCRIGDDG